MDWTGLDWIGLDWTGLDWIGFVKHGIELVKTEDALCSFKMDLGTF